jgi:hypothetical protein
MGIEGVDIATQATEQPRTVRFCATRYCATARERPPVFSVVAGIINYLHINSAHHGAFRIFAP